MSLFTKTVVVRGGISNADLAALEQIFDTLAKGLRERFDAIDKELEDLRTEVERLKAEPRTSLSQRIRARGRA